MFAHMVSQIVLQKELLLAYFTLEFVDQFAFHVTHFMNLQIAHNRKLAATITAAELWFHVDFLVIVQSSLRFEVIVAHVTFEGLKVRMTQLMLLQRVFIGETSATNFAIVIVGIVVAIHVLPERLFRTEL